MQNKNLKKYLPLIAVVILIGIVILLNRKNNDVVQVKNQEDVLQENEQTADTSVIKNPGIVTTQDQVNKLFVKAVEQESKGDYAGAKITLDNALKIKPNDPYITSTYASLYFHMKDNTNALIWIDKAISLKNDLNFWYLKIDIIKSNNDQKSTEDVYLKAIKETSTNVNMVTSYASWLGQIGRKQDAIKQWQKAIEIYPNGKTQFQTEIDLLLK